MHTQHGEEQRRGQKRRGAQQCQQNIGRYSARENPQMRHQGQTSEGIIQSEVSSRKYNTQKHPPTKHRYSFSPCGKAMTDLMDPHRQQRRRNESEQHLRGKINARYIWNNQSGRIKMLSSLDCGCVCVRGMAAHKMCHIRYKQKKHTKWRKKRAH